MIVATAATAATATRAARDSAAVVDAALDSYLADFLDARWQEYLALHSRRYRALVSRVENIVVTLLPAPDGSRRILVVGPRFEVDLLHRVLADVRIDTLGLNEGLFPTRDREQRVLFDLNDADDETRRPVIGPYGLIVMAEVLEHIHMPPSVVMGWIASLLTPGGCLLIQTPNAVSLPNRLRMLVGRNPFQPLSADRAYPDHMREYTPSELVREGRALGLEIAELSTANYFASAKAANRLYQRLERLLPKTLRAGITIVCRAPATPTRRVPLPR